MSSTGSPGVAGPAGDESQGGLHEGMKLLALLEVDTTLPSELALTSMAVSLKRIADTLIKIEQTLHTGNLGQGNNLSGIAMNTSKMVDSLVNVSMGVREVATAKVTALEKALKEARGY